MTAYKATAFIAMLFPFCLIGSVFGEREKRQTCEPADVSRIVREVGVDCNKTIGDFGDSVRLSGAISTSKVNEFAEKICTKSCAKRFLDFARDNNCSLGNIRRQITDVEALCSMNAENKRCVQVYDGSPPIYTNDSCTRVITCPPHCLDQANDFKRRLGCCFGTLIRTPTSFSLLASTVSDCNLETGDSCPVIFSGGVHVSAQSISWLFALLAAFLLAFK